MGRHQHCFDLADFAVLDLEDFADNERKRLPKHRADLGQSTVEGGRIFRNAAVLIETARAQRGP